MKSKLPSIEAHIGQQLKKRREELNLTQHDLATSLEITPQQLSKYERGTDRLPAYRLYQLCKVLIVTPNFFFDGLEEGLICINEQGNRLIWNTLKGQKVRIELGELYGTVSDIKIV